MAKEACEQSVTVLFMHVREVFGAAAIMATGVLE